MVLLCQTGRISLPIKESKFMCPQQEYVSPERANKTGNAHTSPPLCRSRTAVLAGESEGAGPLGRRRHSLF